MAPLTASAHERHSVLTVEDVGAARRAAARLARTTPQIRCADAELLTTELGTNIQRHSATGGYLLLGVHGHGLEMIAVDSGPGIGVGAQPADPPRLGDGLRAGLPSVARLATTMDLYSTTAGTTVLARLLPESPPPAETVSWGGVNVALDGEVESGDAWAVAARADGSLAALVVDGLGHGPQAAAAAEVAVTEFARSQGRDPAEYIRRAHAAMHGTRGGVLGVCDIDPDRGELRHVGVGNVAGRLLLEGGTRGLLSQNGSLGTQLPLPRLQQTTYGWEAGAVLIMTSDGIRSGCDPTSYPGLLERDPTVIAATLHRDFERGTDDATVLVVKDLREPPP